MRFKGFRVYRVLGAWGFGLWVRDTGFTVQGLRLRFCLSKALSAVSWQGIGLFTGLHWKQLQAAWDSLLGGLVIDICYQGRYC